MSRGLLGAAMVVLVLVVVIAAPPRIVHAWDWESVTFEGVVTRTDGTPVANLMVEATDCLNSPIDFTDANGHYRIIGSSHLCFQEPMTISTLIRYSHNLSTRDKNTLIDGTTTTTSTPNHVNTANIQMRLRTIPVPEYGWLSSIIAAGGGIGAIIYIRRGRGKHYSF